MEPLIQMKDCMLKTCCLIAPIAEHNDNKISRFSSHTSNIDSDSEPKCWVCLETLSESASRLLPHGCACRGESRLYCHVKCLAEIASQKEFDLMSKCSGYRDPWLVCPICSQHFTGRLLYILSLVHYARCRELDWEKRDNYLRLRSAIRHIGWASYAQGWPERGLAFLQRIYAVESIKLSSGEEHTQWLKGHDFAYTCFLLGKCLLHADRVEEASSKFEEGLSTLRLNNEPKNREQAVVEAYLLNGLADVYLKRSELAMAVKLQRRDVSITEEIRGRKNIYYMMSCLNLARALLKNGNIKEAVVLANGTKKDAERLLGKNHSLVLSYKKFLLSCSRK